MTGSYEYLVAQLINGIALGTVYGLIAIGYTMVYGVVGMINFAHGEIFMIGSFLSLMAFPASWPDRHHLGTARGLDRPASSPWC